MLDNPEVLRLFRDQFGVAAIAQLVGVGVAERTIRHARQRGVLDLVLPGVVRLANQALDFETRAMAVQLHTADDGVLAGPTAGRIHGLRTMPSRRIWVLTSRRSRMSLPSWVVRTCTSWLCHDADAVMVRGFRVLTPPRLMLTLAEEFNDFQFERAAEDAWHLKLVSPDDMATYVDEYRRQGRAGVGRIERWLAKTGVRKRPSHTGFELDVLDAIRAAALPEPERQHPVTLRSGEVVHLDFAWPEAMFAVEPGGSWWHGGDLKQAGDHARDRACGEVGWQVSRCSESTRIKSADFRRELAATYWLRVRLLGGRTP